MDNVFCNKYDQTAFLTEGRPMYWFISLLGDLNKINSEMIFVSKLMEHEK